VLDGLQVAEAYGTVSLDAPLADEEDASRLDAIGDEDQRLGLVDDQTTIFAAAKHLPQREREILYPRFGEDLTQSEIADRVGVSQMQVSRLLRRSLQRLRQLTGETTSGGAPAGSLRRISACGPLVSYQRYRMRRRIGAL